MKNMIKRSAIMAVSLFFAQGALGAPVSAPAGTFNG